MPRYDETVTRSRIMPPGRYEESVLRRVATVLRHELAARSPVRTGDLRRRTRVILTRRGGFRIVMDVPYAEPVVELYDRRGKSWVQAAIRHTRRIIRAALRRDPTLRTVPGQTRRGTGPPGGQIGPVGSAN